jgi:hypothetical protein
MLAAGHRTRLTSTKPVPCEATERAAFRRVRLRLVDVEVRSIATNRTNLARDASRVYQRWCEVQPRRYPTRKIIERAAAKTLMPEPQTADADESRPDVEVVGPSTSGADARVVLPAQSRALRVAIKKVNGRRRFTFDVLVRQR